VVVGEAMKFIANKNREIETLTLTGEELIEVMRKILKKKEYLVAEDFDVIVRFKTADYSMLDPNGKGDRYAKAVHSSNGNKDRTGGEVVQAVSKVRVITGVQRELDL